MSVLQAIFQAISTSSRALTGSHLRAVPVMVERSLSLSLSGRTLQWRLKNSQNMSNRSRIRCRSSCCLSAMPTPVGILPSGTTTAAGKVFLPRSCVVAVLRHLTLFSLYIMIDGSREESCLRMGCPVSRGGWGQLGQFQRHMVGGGVNHLGGRLRVRSRRMFSRIRRATVL